jgi:putative phosphoesterase
LTYCSDKKIIKIICCGDLASNETLDFFCDNFSGEILYTFGNMEEGHMNISALQKSDAMPGNIIHYRNSNIHIKFGETKIEKKLVAFVHFPDKAKRLAETGKYDFVFYGHTHKPWEENMKNCKLLNPGNVTGDFYPPTFAIWNTENDHFELVRIHNLK